MSAPASILTRTAGKRHGPITRVFSPGDLGELLKPFVFLDYLEAPGGGGPNFGFHPHSGIATLTRQFVDAVAGTKAVILDTRKTTPGLREFERAAVRAGGGTNHRFGLFDQILAKDNHLAVTGDAASLQPAIDRAKAAKPAVIVEIEADNLDQVHLLCGLRGVDIILLDNMTDDEMREAVRIRGERPILLEASGGVNLQTAGAIAKTGVDRISVGALTHSARAADFSMEIR